MEATGRLKPGTSKMMITSLMEDLEKYNPDDVLMAVQKHKEFSEFWPSLAGLMKYIRPEIELRERYGAYLARERKIMSFMLDGADPESTKRITSAFARRGITHAEPEKIENKSGFKIPELKRLT